MDSTDRDWLLPSAVLTTLLGAIAVALMTVARPSSMPDPLFSLAGWFAWTFIFAGAGIILFTLKLMSQGEKKPIAVLRSKFRSDSARHAVIAVGMLMAGVDMYFFMIVKPELNALFPFWADPLLSRIDHRIFGTDPWRLFVKWDLRVMSWVYGPFWFVSVSLTFFWLLLKAPSKVKSTAILAYFAIWSVFGPIGQVLLSSAGPIFYNRLGLGDRFAGMPIPPLTQTLSDYLWKVFQSRGLAPGAGISAMPSLHIATMAWVLMAVASFRSGWILPAIVLSLYIYAGSIALGWHYATDGLAGVVGAALCYIVAQQYLNLGATVQNRRAPDEPLLRA